MDELEEALMNFAEYIIYMAKAEIPSDQAYGRAKLKQEIRDIASAIRSLKEKDSAEQKEGE